MARAFAEAPRERPVAENPSRRDLSGEMAIDLRKLRNRMQTEMDKHPHVVLEGPFGAAESAGVAAGNAAAAEQRQQLEEDQPDAEDIDFEAPEVDKVVFNKDTNRIILRNLMENGIREATGAHPGKTIIFARNHRHAILLSELFDEMYPQYGGEFCRVIDNYDPRAEQLIDNFKDPKHPLTIAVSVDMLDTGIDVPEVVNLVFAKPVKSFVKFWQMIGRGTRLCQNLFGPGKDKTSFSIFDHWGNFEFFEQTY